MFGLFIVSKYRCTIVDEQFVRNVETHCPSYTHLFYTSQINELGLTNILVYQIPIKFKCLIKNIIINYKIP